MSSQEFEGAGGEGLDGRGADRGTGARGAAEEAGRPADEVAGYAAEVRAQFADLPDAEGAELLEDLEDHLREVAAEDAGTLRERLGAPAAYARELRQAAGLPEPGEGSGPGGPGTGSRPRRTLRSRVRQVMADAEDRARGYRAGREVLDFLPSLRPAWWVLRAWAAVRLLEVVTTTADPWHSFSLIPQVDNSTMTGLVALLLAIPASVYAARRTVPDGWRRRAMGAGEGILVLFTVGMALSAIGQQGDYPDNASQVAYVQTGRPGLVQDGKQLSNLYVYDQSGRLLDGVFVYDQDGQPVSVRGFEGRSVFDNDGWLDGNGALVPNIFPQQVLEPQWSGTDGNTHLVVVPPPSVSVPQGVHRGSAPDGVPQGSATPTATPSATPALPSTSPSIPGPSVSVSGSSSAPGGAPGAHSSSALPSTPAPSSTTG